MRRQAAPPPRQDRRVPVVVSPSFMVLDRVVDLANLDHAPLPGWESIHCSSKKAYGCGIYLRKLVEGLALYVHHDDLADLTSLLSIRLSGEALGSIRAELGVGDTNGILHAEGVISNVSQQLLVLLVTFRINNGNERSYCLVFDSTDASLCMIPCIPPPLEACYTPTVIPLRAACEKDHELTLIVQDSSRRMGRCRLCVSTPATRAKSTSDCSSPWKVTQKLHFPQLSPPLSPDVMFSFQGKVFWADLSQGVAYCDMRARDGAQKFKFIKLPKDYRIHWDLRSDEPRDAPQMSRTMGCDGGSIKFICIDRSDPRCGNEMVKVWTLDLDHGRWKESNGVRWKELWKKVNFMQADPGDVVPQYPTLMRDGALCLLCHKPRGHKPRSLKGPDFICSFDMRSKSLLSFGPVVHHDTITCVVMPHNFFKMCNPPPLHKRKLPPNVTELPTQKKKLLSQLPTHNRMPPMILNETPNRIASPTQ